MGLSELPHYSAPMVAENAELEWLLVQIAKAVPLLDSTLPHIRAKASNNVARYVATALQLVRG